jgi:hypothetical protein
MLEFARVFVNSHRHWPLRPSHPSAQPPNRRVHQVLVHDLPHRAIRFVQHRPRVHLPWQCGKFAVHAGVFQFCQLMLVFALICMILLNAPLCSLPCSSVFFNILFARSCIGFAKVPPMWTQLFGNTTIPRVSTIPSRRRSMSSRSPSRSCLLQMPATITRDLRWPMILVRERLCPLCMHFITAI